MESSSENESDAQEMETNVAQSDTKEVSKTKNNVEQTLEVDTTTEVQTNSDEIGEVKNSQNDETPKPTTTNVAQSDTKGESKTKNDVEETSEVDTTTEVQTNSDEKGEVKNTQNDETPKPATTNVAQSDTKEESKTKNNVEQTSEVDTTIQVQPNSDEKGEVKNSQDDETPKPESSSENVHYEGDIAIYTDPSTNYQYIWNTEKEEWVPRSNETYGFEDDTHTYTDAEGAKYFWDKERNAWFPKIDDDFMARYQLNYGFVDNTQEVKKEEQSKEIKEPQPAEVKPKEQALKRKAPPPEPTWFDVEDEHNTNVYVSNLPLDLTEQEFVDFMQKCGLVMRESATGKMKIKLYTDSESKLFKGDALCTYIRIESVDLALKLLDGSDLKGYKVNVERAKFQMKGAFDPSLKPKKRKKKEKDKLKRMQEKLFDWRPERMRGERAKHEKVVIVKNVFESSMFDTDVGLILEFQQDLREECSKCGNVRKVIIYDRHPEGVAQVNMKEPEEADAVVQLLNGRWFGKRKLTAEIWNGKTKYKIAETDSQISQRIEKWDKFLEGEEQKTETQKNLKEPPTAKEETIKN